MNDPSPESPFRQKSLERLSSPDKLDELMQVISPKGWWWVGSLGFVVFAILCWAIFARIPLTVTGQGILVFPRKVTSIQSLASGRLIDLKASLGQKIQKGQVIAVIEQAELSQEFKQQERELEQLKKQFNRENKLQDLQNKQDIDSINQQRDIYQRQVNEAVYFGNVLKNQSLASLRSQKKDYQQQIQQISTTGIQVIKDNRQAIEAQRQSLQEQLKNAYSTLKNLQAIYQKQKELREKELITVNIILQTEQQILQTLDKISTINSQFKQLDSQESQLKQSEINNHNKIESLKAQIQQLVIQEDQIEEKFIQNQQNINQIKTKLVELKSQETEIDLNNQKNSDQQNDQIVKLQYEIEQLKLKMNDQVYIKSSYNGTILGLEVQPGKLIEPGQNIVRIMRSDVQDNLECFTFLKIGDGKQVRQGMKAEITPTSVKKNDYGGIIGKVTIVSPVSVTIDEISRAIGDQQLAQSLTADNHTIGVKISLEPDPKTYSGYKWSSRGGPTMKISQGTTTITEITVEERAPITFVIPLLKSLTGMN